MNVVNESKSLCVSVMFVMQNVVDGFVLVFNSVPRDHGDAVGDVVFFAKTLELVCFGGRDEQRLKHGEGGTDLSPVVLPLSHSFRLLTARTA